MPPRVRTDPKSVAGKALHVDERMQVLVIGAGPAGLSAAIEAAGLGLSVVLVDENPVAFETMGDEVPLHFGQGMTGAVRNRNAMMEAFVASEPLIEQAFEAGVDLRLGTACWGLYGNGPGVGWLPGTVAGLDDGERVWMIGAEHVVVATGRRDMGLAFPGWEKAGVMGATAATVLAKRYDAFGPRRVIVLGTSEEAIETARTLQDTGVEVVAIVEQAAVPLCGEAALRAFRDAGTAVLTAHVVAEATGHDAVDGALVVPVEPDGRRAGPGRAIACDGIVLAVGAVPVVDLLDAAGVRIAFQQERGGHAPVVDDAQRTDRAGVYAVGDCAGIWSAKNRDRSIAEAEGMAAAAAIADAEKVPGLRAPTAISAPPATHDIGAYRLAWVRASVVEAQAEVQVCQCEEVTARELIEVRPPRYLGWADERRNDRSLSALLGEGPPNPDQVKRLTRAGMGQCQGRRCREQVAALLALASAVPLASVPLASHRAPVRPLPLSRAGQVPEAPEQAEHWDTWFGMHAQWRPFWDVPARYTVAGNDTTGEAASE